MSLLTVQASRTKVPSTKETELYVLASLQTPKAPKGHKRAPIQLAIALDVSASMNEDTNVVCSALDKRVLNKTLEAPRADYQLEATKLEVAKDTLLKIVDALDERDSMSLVTFSDGATRNCLTIPLNAKGKERFIEAILNAQVRGNTNLCAGLYAALWTLNAVHNADTRRCLLFTDGEANSGPVDLETIRDRLSRDDFDKYSISTFGFGDTYNVELLAGLVAHGGSHYYIKDAEAIPTSFAAEIGGLLSMHAEDVELSVLLGKDVVDFEVLNDIKVTKAPSEPLYTLRLPDLINEQTFDVCMRLKFAKRTKGDALPLLSVGGSLVEMATKQRKAFSEACTISVTPAKSADKDDDKDVMSRVAMQIAAKAQREADAQARKGDYKGAKATYLNSAARARAYGQASLGATMDWMATNSSTETQYRRVGSKAGATISTTMSNQRSSTGGQSFGGDDLGAAMLNETQKSMVGTFSITKAADVDDVPNLDDMITSP